MGAERILDFWFDGNIDDPHALDRAVARWFQGDEALDRTIAGEFEPLIPRAAAGEFETWGEEARGRLALILLLDQFPRNAYRDTPNAFAFDRIALAHCLEGISRGQDLGLHPVERVFFYLPLEHAESLPVQDESVRRFEALRDEAPEALAAHFENFHAFAERHREIILRFDRFPHRNAILGRPSTPAETAFIEEAGRGF